MALHSSLPDAELHYPKGASSATAGQIMRATGSGTTSWGNFPFMNIAQMSISHPTTPITVSVTGTGSDDLKPSDGGYVNILNAFTSALTRGTNVTVLADGRFQFNAPGTVVVTGFADLTHSVYSSTVGVAFAFTRSGVTTLSARAVHSKMPAAGDIGSIAGVGTIEVLAGDILGLAVASDKTGTISLRSSSLVAQHIPY